jgi:hypothetical protein
MKRSHRCEPTNPAPPVINVRTIGPPPDGMSSRAVGVVHRAAAGKRLVQEAVISRK